MGSKNFERETTILVFDFGGGTFDVSILSIKEGEFHVRATSGNTHLGGEDMYSRMVTHFVKRIKKDCKTNISQNLPALRRLRLSCEKAKRALSSTAQTTVYVNSLFDRNDFRETITRAFFENLNDDLFQSTLDTVERALRDANMNKSDIDEIILVGGSTRIPKVQKMLQEYFDGKQLTKGINPDEAIAHGAALRAASLSGQKSKEVKDLVLIDVTPLSLGIERKGGIMSVIVERNTTIPVRKTGNIYRTSRDNQTQGRIGVYEGERILAKDNNLLGKLDLTGIPPAQRGQQTVNVTFDIDASGILSVIVVVESTGNKEEITILNEKGYLPSTEIERLIEESDKFRSEDKRRKAAIEARNRLEYYCLDTRRDNVNDSDKQFIVDKCNEVLHWLEFHKDAEKEEFEQKIEELQEECNDLK